MMTIFVLIWIVVFLVWYVLIKTPVERLDKRLPGPKGYPIIGNVNLFLGQPHKLFNRLYAIFKNYDRMTALWIGPKLNLFVYNADDIETILQGGNSNIIKSEEYDYLKPWLGEGLISMREASSQYRKHKRIIRPFFSMGNLLSTLPIFNKNARILVKDLVQYANKGEININPILSLFSIYNILETSLGIKYENMNETMLEYINNIEELGNIAHQRHYKYWLRPEWLFQFSSLKKQQDECLRFVNPVTISVIDERRRLLGQNDQTDSLDDKYCFVDNMLLAKDECGNKLSLDEIKDEVMTVMFAGQDTTTATMGFVLSLLGIHTDVQDRLIKEIDDNLESTEHLQLSQDSLKNFVYLEQVIKETWRLYPPVPVVGRTAVKNIQLDEYTVPKNCTIAILIMHLHRNPKYFKDPHKFNPDNFSPDNMKSLHPFCFIPFSAGYRTCIGRQYSTMLVKIVLIHFFNKFRVTSIRDESSFRLSGQITLKRKEGFLISIHNRN